MNSSFHGVHEFKFAIIGDSGVGKTSAIMAYVDGEYPHDGVPGKFPACSVLVTLQNEQVTLLPADTIGRKEYAQDRVLAYAGAGVVLLCYDVMERKSFENITKKWMAEVELCAPTIPIILVGTKVEQRLVRERPRSQSAPPGPTSSSTTKRSKKKVRFTKQKPVTKREGEDLAESIGASKFIEVSAMAKIKLQTLFKSTASIALAASISEPDEKGCTVM